MSYFSKLRTQSNDGIGARLSRATGGQSTSPTDPGTVGGVGIPGVAGTVGLTESTPQSVSIGIPAISPDDVDPAPQDPGPTNGPANTTAEADADAGDDGGGDGGSGSSSGDSGGGGGGDGGSALRRGGRARR